MRIDGRVAPRSGLAHKHGIDTLAGVIDADYRGPVGVILANLSDTDFEVKVGDRIAQLIVEKVWNTSYARQWVYTLNCGKKINYTNAETDRYARGCRSPETRGERTGSWRFW